MGGCGWQSQDGDSPSSPDHKAGPCWSPDVAAHGQLETLPGLLLNTKAKDPLYAPLLARDSHHTEPIVGLWEAVGWRDWGGRTQSPVLPSFFSHYLPESETVPLDPVHTGPGDPSQKFSPGRVQIASESPRELVSPGCQARPAGLLLRQAENLHL